MKYYILPQMWMRKLNNSESTVRMRLNTQLRLFFPFYTAVALSHYVQVKFKVGSTLKYHVLLALIHNCTFEQPYRTSFIIATIPVDNLMNSQIVFSWSYSDCILYSVYCLRCLVSFYELFLSLLEIKCPSRNNEGTEPNCLNASV